MENKEVCTMGCELWIKYTENGVTKSTDYFEGAFKAFYCDYRDEKCPFKNPTECAKYIKFKNE